MAAVKLEHIGPAPRIAVHHAGAGSLVVFLHGIGGNKTNWRDQILDFAKHFHAAAWDARGYGDSDDYEGPLRYQDFADDLVRVIDHFGAGQAHLVGLSMGGFIVQEFHARYAGRVASMTLCDTRATFGSAPSPEANADFIRLRLKPLQEGREPSDIAPAVARSLVAPDAPPEIVQRLIDSISALHKDSYMKTLQARGTWKCSFDPRAVTVPTLVVCGAEDRLTPPSASQELADGIAGARLALIPGAGHLSNIEKPAAFNRVVIEFLRGIAA
jgi:3-oxoadipate enol-lactonase